MAPSFMLLPLEIRNHIYGYVLDLNDDILLAPYDAQRHAIHDGSLESTPSAAASPNSHLMFYHDVSLLACGPRSRNSDLIQTCRLIHEEVVPFLYTDKTFAYRFMNKMHYHSSWYTTWSFPQKNLQLIQDLVLKIVARWINRATPKEVESGVADLVAHGCGARHLMLDLGFISGAVFVVNRKRWMRDAAERTKIQQSIAALQFLQDIKIRVCGNIGTSYLDEIYGQLVAKIEAAKEWVGDDDNGRSIVPT